MKQVPPPSKTVQLDYTEVFYTDAVRHLDRGTRGSNKVYLTYNEAVEEALGAAPDSFRIEKLFVRRAHLEAQDDGSFLIR